jgi:hypothetical protein
MATKYSSGRSLSGERRCVLGLEPLQELRLAPELRKYLELHVGAEHNVADNTLPKDFDLESLQDRMGFAVRVLDHLLAVLFVL